MIRSIRAQAALIAGLLLSALMPPIAAQAAVPSTATTTVVAVAEADADNSGKGEPAMTGGELLTMLVVGLLLFGGGTALFIARRERRPAAEPEDEFFE